MFKQVIFKPRKSLTSATKNVEQAVRDLGLKTATSIGIEILKIDGIYYTVKNVYHNLAYDIIVSTDDATERFSAKQLVI